VQVHQELHEDHSGETLKQQGLLEGRPKLPKVHREDPGLGAIEAPSAARGSAGQLDPEGPANLNKVVLHNLQQHLIPKEIKGQEQIIKAKQEQKLLQAQQRQGKGKVVLASIVPHKRDAFPGL
jgi:hypothetical protein